MCSVFEERVQLCLLACFPGVGAAPARPGVDPGPGLGPNHTRLEGAAALDLAAKHLRKISHWTGS